MNLSEEMKQALKSDKIKTKIAGDVFKVESKYINEFNSINNGFNTVISNKNVISNAGTLFENLK